MKTNLAMCLLFSAAVAVLAGCAAKPVSTAAPTHPVPAQTHAAATTPEAEPDIPLPPGVAKAPLPFEGEGWRSLFDGQSLWGWRETAFAGRNEVRCQAGLLVLKMGDPFTGVNFTNDFPKMNYEIALDAMRVMGSDFFCGLTLPVGTNCCSLIVGGWGGSLVGISSLDGMDASENETSKFLGFKNGQWYRIRLRVTEKKIQAWIDEEKIIDVATLDRKITVRPGDIELSQPIGLACWQSAAAFREIKVRRLEP